MLKDSKKLAVNINVLEFENKRFIKTLKVKKKKKNRSKQLNLLDEKYNSS